MYLCSSRAHRFSSSAVRGHQKPCSNIFCSTPTNWSAESSFGCSQESPERQLSMMFKAVQGVQAFFSTRFRTPAQSNGMSSFIERLQDRSQVCIRVKARVCGKHGICFKAYFPMSLTRTAKLDPTLGSIQSALGSGSFRSYCSRAGCSCDSVVLLHNQGLPQTRPTEVGFLGAGLACIDVWLSAPKAHGKPCNMLRKRNYIFGYHPHGVTQLPSSHQCVLSTSCAWGSCCEQNANR